jgi:hypothetical protein
VCRHTIEENYIIIIIIILLVTILYILPVTKGLSRKICWKVGQLQSGTAGQIESGPAGQEVSWRVESGGPCSSSLTTGQLCSEAAR